MNELSRLLLAALMLTVCPAFGADNQDEEIQAATLVKKGEALADFTCVDTNGKQHTLSSLKGKVVVLYFFSASNLSSLADLQCLESEIFQRLRDEEDFRLLAIGRDYEREELVKLGGERKLTYPLVADPQQEIYRRYFTKYVPRMVVVRRDGSVAYETSGAAYEKILRLQSVLAQELTLK